MLIPAEIAKLPPPSAKRNNTIMSKLLPLFPLQLVVFPRTQVPLHIFEERYKLMVSESIAAGSEFGIMLAQGEGIVNAGCSVRVEDVITQYEDGRMDILTTGARRFEIVDLNQDKAYLRGQVNFFEDDAADLVPASLRKEALAVFQTWIEGRGFKSAVDPDESDAQLSFQLAQSVQDLSFQSMLLRDRSELSRLQQLITYFEQQLPREQQVTRMKHLAPMNGFGAKPADL
jgi:Lon protease-like protein